MEEAVELPIDGVLDLHAFLPREVKDLIPAYLSACRNNGIFEVRIVHGKGSGTLRRTVHSILSRLDYVASFRLAEETGGGWGATLVVLQGSTVVKSIEEKNRAGMIPDKILP